ncbi:GNAT family N-acetyltransferase [Halobacillus sp. ACCC02827]|uniref:GNAT family N-acetyltransferase n=1 Tax=unclassified Halobacillus TaxID=2636472 RepID=UPI0002A4EAF5|nr:MULTISPECIES: GNAT family N-acetyltransferase [unclassified Halobacillus]ELK45775.1 GNAT family acetyltransferase [Halobacillus sp. BAB-2008]WJE15474.1 GNAT family N-acetyltransferase [Halobacillus sp. ACCC02827]
MVVRKETDPVTFLNQVEGLLMHGEAQNNLPLGLLEDRKRTGTDQVCHMLTVIERENPVYAVLRTPPHLWILPSTEVMEKPFIKQLVDYLHGGNYEVPGVLGDRRAVQWFVEEWENVSGLKGSLHMEQGIYRLDDLQPIADAPGELVPAVESDLPLLQAWMYQFGIETGEKNISERAEVLAAEMVEERKIYLWKVDGEPVSMAARARATKNGATINAVYTPDVFKRNGYASKAVWHLTDKLLRSGYRFCSLYTDMANPTSNSIYKRIGYKHAGDSIVYTF